ncbi:MAG: MATE family efflux transporter [Alphaproteobacteria bacterium]|nr:MATE family efflux transporter [Alphaproteobacteria bacterium]
MITYNYKKILNISYPLMLGMLIQVLVGMTDTAFLGRVGEIELGASALGSVIYLFVYMIEQSFAVGAQIIMARRNGEKNYIKIGHVFYQTINFILILSLLCIAFFYLYAQNILNYIIIDNAVKMAVSTYLLPRCWGLIFAGITTVFRAYLVAINKTNAIFVSALIMLVSNFVFDFWLIFGGLGIEPMGLAGAAVASVLAEALTMLYFIGYLVVKTRLKKYGFHKYLLWKQSLFNNIFRLSVWIMLQNLLNWGSWLYFFIEIEKLGANALAISNILRSVSSIPYVIASALSVVISSIISNLIGAGKDHEVLSTIVRTIKLGAVPYYICFLIMALFPEELLRIYTDNFDLIKQATNPFYAMLIPYMFALPALIYFYAICGTGKTKIAMFVEFLSSIVYVISIRLIIAIFDMGLTWSWTTEFYYYIIMLPISYWYMKRKKWCCEII